MKTERFSMRKKFYAQIKNLLMLCSLVFSLSAISGCSNDDEPKDENNGSADFNGYEYVDLGLPSGLLWATCNVGATTPEEYGAYFAWGETTTKEEYTEFNSATYGKTMSDISGDAKYDAATANWGDSWRMPTKNEIKELIDNCTWLWGSQNGVNGYKVKGKNGNWIFLPAAGYRYGSSLSIAGSYGDYWGSTPYESNASYACSLYFGSSNYYRGYSYRYYGRSVRPVTE